MRFNENASLDSSQVQDRRRGDMFGGGSAIAVGGGGLGLVIAVIALLMGVDPGDLGGVIQDQSPATSYQQPADVSQNSQLASACRTGADANNRDDCRIVGVVNSVQKYWTDDFSRRGQQYQVAPTRRSAALPTPVWASIVRGGAVLLPERQSGLPRSQLLPGVTAEVRGEGRAVRAGVRRGPRVRSPHPGFHRHPR